MKVKEIVEALNLKLLAGESGLSKEVKGAYICDLLSWVMSHAKNNDAWITIQTHPNVIAVAALVNLSCIIVPENAEVEKTTIDKANEESIPLLISNDSGYKIGCMLYDIIKDE